ncbi:MAG: hypothetical protein AAFV77_09030, partial [Planctomycetota bacterium]
MDVHAFQGLDLSSVDEVCHTLEAAAEAGLNAACRRGPIDWVEGPGRLIATGDIHDNPLHLSRIIEAAGLDDDPEQTPESERSHVTLHELIHGE